MKADLTKENIINICRRLLAKRIKAYRAYPCTETRKGVNFALGYFPSKHQHLWKRLDKWIDRRLGLTSPKSIRRSLTVKGARNALAKRIRAYRADWTHGSTMGREWRRIERALYFFPEKRRRIELRLYHWMRRVDPFDGKPARPVKPLISREELAALLGMFSKHGRAWKVVLKNRWRTNTADPVLTSLRDANHFGLGILDKLKLSDLQQVKEFYEKNP